MARLVLSPMACTWLVVLLMLLSGETVFTDEAACKDLQGSTCSTIRQFPRFIAKKRGSTVEMKCKMNTKKCKVSWFWKRNMNSEPEDLLLNQGHIKQAQNITNITYIDIITLDNIQWENNGLYFCQRKCEDGSLEKSCGTELRVMEFSTLAQLKWRNTVKDSIIMIQTLLIILFITVPIFLLLDKDDSKAGMDEDHTYEGLNIDQTATYEDIVTLRTGEVKWSVGEHPGQE